MSSSALPLNSISIDSVNNFLSITDCSLDCVKKYKNSNLIYRIVNIIKALWGRSDWQLAKNTLKEAIRLKICSQNKQVSDQATRIDRLVDRILYSLTYPNHVQDFKAQGLYENDVSISNLFERAMTNSLDSNQLYYHLKKISQEELQERHRQGFLDQMKGLPSSDALDALRQKVKTAHTPSDNSEIATEIFDMLLSPPPAHVQQIAGRSESPELDRYNQLTPLEILSAVSRSPQGALLETSPFPSNSVLTTSSLSIFTSTIKANTNKTLKQFGDALDQLDEDEEREEEEVVSPSSLSTSTQLEDVPSPTPSTSSFGFNDSGSESP